MGTSVIYFLFALLSTWGAYPEEENGELEGLVFGGDMVLTPEQWEMVQTGGDISLAGQMHRARRAIMSNVSVLWLPNNKVVPYTIAEELETEAAATFALMAGFREWEERSCLTFKKKTDEKDFVRFFQGSGCWSYVGKRGGLQNISLAERCWRVGTVVHEIGHAVGFGHEQNRPDRDQYIKVRWENIRKGKGHNFKKYRDSKVDSLNSPYDYKSFMQYSKRAFGVNRSVTLDPLQPNIFQLGQRVGFTERDQYQAMGLYRCGGKTTRKTTVFSSYDLTGDWTCDFETDFCGFSQDPQDNFDWSRRYGSTPSKKTGPDSDHTTGRLGTYIYIEASPPQKPNHVARLKSKVFSPTLHRHCFSFFYSMFAHNKSMMGKFNVYFTDQRDRPQLVLSRTASHSNNEWKHVQFDFIPTGAYQFTFEGFRGTGYQGDIAIDDLSVTKGTCIAQSPPKKEVSNAPCKDIDDREAEYCGQWKKAGFCSEKRKEMEKFCVKTCNFC